MSAEYNIAKHIQKGWAHLQVSQNHLDKMHAAIEEAEVEFEAALRQLDHIYLVDTQSRQKEEKKVS